MAERRTFHHQLPLLAREDRYIETPTSTGGQTSCSQRKTVEWLWHATAKATNVESIAASETLRSSWPKASRLSSAHVRTANITATSPQSTSAAMSSPWAIEGSVPSLRGSPRSTWTRVDAHAYWMRNTGVQTAVTSESHGSVCTAWKTKNVTITEMKRTPRPQPRRHGASKYVHV